MKQTGNRNKAVAPLIGLGCIALFGPLPVGRWLTFHETIKLMAIHPKDSDIVWDGHKNNPRPETGLVLSALEKVEPLRHLIRRVELHIFRLRLHIAGIFRNERRLRDLM
jgi:hypothetical protein